MFSYEYCEIFKTTYFGEHMLMAAFDIGLLLNPFHATCIFFLPLENVRKTLIFSRGIEGNQWHEMG